METAGASNSVKKSPAWIRFMVGLHGPTVEALSHTPAHELLLNECSIKYEPLLRRASADATPAAQPLDPRGRSVPVSGARERAGPDRSGQLEIRHHRHRG